MIYSVAMITSVFAIGARAMKQPNITGTTEQPTGTTKQPTGATKQPTVTVALERTNSVGSQGGAGAPADERLHRSRAELHAGEVAAQLALKLYDMVRLERETSAGFTYEKLLPNTHLVKEIQLEDGSLYDPIKNIQGLREFECEAGIATMMYDCKHNSCYNAPVFIHMAAMIHAKLKLPELIEVPFTNTKDNTFVDRHCPQISQDARVRVPEGSYIGVYDISKDDPDFIHGMMAVGYTKCYCKDREDPENHQHLLVAGVKNQPLTGNKVPYNGDFGIYDLTSWMQEHEHARGNNTFTDGDGARRLSLKYKPLHVHAQAKTNFAYSTKEYKKKYFPEHSGCAGNCTIV